MEEFYATVVPVIRSPRFGNAGKHVRLLLNDYSDYTMMAIVGAVRDRQRYHEQDIYSALDRLSTQDIISFAMQNPHKYWGDGFFAYLEGADKEDFPGNKQKLAKLKARWGCGSD